MEAVALIAAVREAAKLVTNGPLRERLALAADRLAMVEQLAKDQAEKIGDLQRETDSLRAQVKALTQTRSFIEHAGAKWKRRPTGEIERVVYCWTCEVPTASFAGDHFDCPRCNGFTDFGPRELDRIIASIPGR